MRRLRSASVGKTIARVRPASSGARRRISPARLRSLARRARDARRAPRQASALHARRRARAARALSHERRLGRWISTSDELPRFARAAIDFTDGTRVVLDDSRALSTLELHAANAPPDLGLGPEPNDPSLTPESLHAMLVEEARSDQAGAARSARHRGTRQHLRGGIALACAIAPTAPASSLSRSTRSRRLLAAIRKVIKTATGRALHRFVGVALAVYDREGKPCRRCRTPIERITQAGRSTYFCLHRSLRSGPSNGSASCRCTTAVSRALSSSSALDVSCFRNRQHFRMIERLAGDRAQRDAPPGVRRGVLQHLEKERLREMKAAARGEEQSAGREQPHRAQVDVLVAANRRGQRRLVLRERRRIEHDRVEALAGASAARGDSRTCRLRRARRS